MSFRVSSIFLLRIYNKGKELFKGVLNSWLKEFNKAYWNLNLWVNSFNSSLSVIFSIMNKNTGSFVFVDNFTS